MENMKKKTVKGWASDTFAKGWGKKDMNYLEKAIEDAMKGGWEPAFLYRVEKEVGFGDLFNQMYSGIFLSADFWQCLGKSREWREHENRSMKEKILGVYGPEWRVHQHQLLDALAEGRTIESFFASLSVEK